MAPSDSAVVILPKHHTQTMALFEGDNFRCPYSTRGVFYDNSDPTKYWEFPMPDVPLGRTADRLPDLPAPLHALRGPNEKQELDNLAETLRSFVVAYVGIAVAGDRGKQARVQAMLSEKLLPPWSKDSLRRSWRSCRAQEFDWPAPRTPATFEVKLCAAFTQSGRCPNLENQGCCWYAHVPNIAAVRAAGNVWNCRKRVGGVWRVHRDFWQGRRSLLHSDEAARVWQEEDGLVDDGDWQPGASTQSAQMDPRVEGAESNVSAGGDGQMPAPAPEPQQVVFSTYVEPVSNNVWLHCETTGSWGWLPRVALPARVHSAVDGDSESVWL